MSAFLRLGLWLAIVVVGGALLVNYANLRRAGEDPTFFEVADPSPIVDKVRTLTEGAKDQLESLASDFPKPDGKTGFDPRIWKSTTGSTVQAELVSYTPTEATLKTEEGKLITVSQNQLSRADLAYLEKTPELRDEESFVPRLRVSTSAKTSGNHSRMHIRLTSLERERVDNIKLFWTWAYIPSSRVTIDLQKMKNTKFLDAGSTTTSLAPFETISVTSAPHMPSGSTQMADGMVAQVYIGEDLVAYYASRSAFNDAAKDPNLRSRFAIIKQLPPSSVKSGLETARQ